MNNRPLATLSLDLDNLWAYLKTKGDPTWCDFPSYLDSFVPMILDILDRLDLKITFFIVGQDAALPQHREVLREIAARGHELANHSFHHDPALSAYTVDQMDSEIARAEEAIFEATQRDTKGFRGPGFSWSPTLLQVLAARDYVYDATVFPTIIGPLAKHYYRWRAQPSEEAQRSSPDLYGTFRQGLYPLKPFCWQVQGEKKLVELPTTTLPFLRLPFHMSYLMAVANLSEIAMTTYLALALALCHGTSTPPQFLLHPTDLMGRDRVPQLAFFPGMALSSSRKVDIFLRVMGALQQKFRLLPMGTFVSEYSSLKALRVVTIPQ